MSCIVSQMEVSVPSKQLLLDLFIIISLKVCVKLTSMGLELSDNFETVTLPLLKVVANANHFKL